MRSRRVLALAGTSAVVSVAAGAAVAGGALAAQHGPAATSGPAVTIRIEGSSKTLVLPKRVHAPSGWITKYGAPRGKCPGQSAQGVLDAVTHGHWRGKWYSSYNEYLVTAILGEKPPGKQDFWEIFVNNKAASVGACEIKPHRGQKLLFVDTNGKDNPAQLTAPQSAVAGTTFTVRLVGFNAHGASRPLAGVKVTGNGIQPVTTNSRGVARVRDSNVGRLVLRASPGGYIRTEAEVKLAHR